MSNKERRSRGRAHPRAPQLLIRRRVDVVAHLVAIGVPRGEICRYVSGQQRKEASQRRAMPGGTDDVPLLWGDEPLTQRTLDRYIARAKTEVAGEVLQFVANSSELFAMHIAQLDALYHTAFRKGRYGVCARILEQKHEIFHFDEVARALAPAADAAAETDQVPLVRIVVDGPPLPPESRARIQARYGWPEDSGNGASDFARSIVVAPSP